MDKRILELYNDCILKEAAMLFGISIDNIYKIGGFENLIYGYSMNEKDYILRISHSYHRTKELVEAELDFVFFLSENNANVSTPIRSKNNRLVECINLDNKSYFIVTSFTKAKGEKPRRELINDDLFVNYGKTIGQFHKLTKEYKAGIAKRYIWFEDPIIKNAKQYLPDAESIIYEKFINLVETLKELEMNISNFGLIHTDIHMGNFFIKDNQLTVFDFDDLAYQFFISDIAIALFYYVGFVYDLDKRTKMAENFMFHFMKGYNQENTLANDDFLKIDLFLKLREFILFIVIYRTSDLDNDKWAKDYIEFYRTRLIDDIPFLNIDFRKYL